MAVRNRMSRPKDDGIIDEVAIARVFAGDEEVGKRLTPREYDEVIRRASERLARDEAVVLKQRTKGMRSRVNVSIGPEEIDELWMENVSIGLGMAYMHTGKPGRNFSSLRKAIARCRDRAASAA